MREHTGKQFFAFVAFTQLERIGQYNALERNVRGLADAVIRVRRSVVERVFNIDSSNVIRQQNDFVGVHFLRVLAVQVLGAYQVALQQAGHKSARAGEGVEDVDIFVAERAAELFTQQGIG
ncbi:MAG TPA: hypothetical protein PLO67_18255, partial [Saprospiraceae bacterium]|nr:hypothetical protein [Saprospiraceae bacterium]